MKKKQASFLSKPYSRILIPNEDGSYSAEVLEFPGCFAQGETVEDALRNLESAAESWIEVSLSQKHEIPEPAMYQGYSGNIMLRLPRGLHRQAARMAQREGVSLNQYLVTAVAARLGAEDFYNRLADKFESRMANTAANIVIRGLGLFNYRTAELPYTENYQLAEAITFKPITSNRAYIEEPKNA
jgi:predicted RNase H-like HicB family nuclease